MSGFVETLLSDELVQIAERLQPLYARLATHKLYEAFGDVGDLRVFMESHVFAVWDFMSLLKTLQGGLTCIEVPWVPGAFAESRRLVNEIVLGEESDIYRGEVVSHFELYYGAMRECGADTFAIDNLLRGLTHGDDWELALKRSGALPAVQSFVRSTFGFVASGKLHVVAAAFTFGREDLIPEMFRGFLREQDQRMEGRLATFRWYLERHIEVDGEEHGPMALRMVSELCAGDAIKWQEVADAAESALRARLSLWDGILAELTGRRHAAAVQ